jgi:hypothetical protein
LHYLGELQDWSDTVPETLRRTNQSTPSQLRAINFLSLRWLDAIMVATRPFLASLARFGPAAFSARTRGFFVFCATVASIAAVETLSLMRSMEQQRQIKGLTAFDRHFLVQSASILALSSVVQKGIRDERLRFRECIEMLLRLPGSQNDNLIRSMRTVESKLERFSSVRMYPRRYTPSYELRVAMHIIFSSRLDCRRWLVKF